jgi:hypothetical protein
MNIFDDSEINQLEKLLTVLKNHRILRFKTDKNGAGIEIEFKEDEPSVFKIENGQEEDIDEEKEEDIEDLMLSDPMAYENLVKEQL